MISIIVIGSGEFSIFVKVKQATKGEYLITSSGIEEAGLSLEESQQRLDDRYDDTMYTKPVAMVKKLVKRIK